MAIIEHDDWDFSEKGKKDAERHHEKIDDAIRKNVRDVISEESIITKKRGRKIRIPVRGLKDYRFIHGRNEGSGAGVGQGDGKPGDIIDQQGKQGKAGQGKKGGKAGQQKGVDYMEAEIDIDYLIKIMFEHLGLPWIDEKTKKQQLVPKGWKFETISKKGIQPRIHKKRTMMEAVKRQIVYTAEIMKQTNCDKQTAKKSLRQSRGDIKKAIKIIKENKLTEKLAGVKIHDDDIRYKQIEPDVEYQSQAAVICMMDVSGSMTTDKKYLARSTLFWLCEFLKKCYDNVDIKFIVHTTEARLVDEDTFFYKGESGGTNCASAFEKANYLIDTEFPINEWNVYVVYFSDGEDWDSKKTIVKIDEMLSKKINMLSYIEIKPEADAPFGGYYDNTLLKEITNKWKFVKKEEEGTDFYKNEEEHFLINIIKNRNHVWPVLKWILFDKQKG